MYGEIKEFDGIMLWILINSKEGNFQMERLKTVMKYCFGEGRKT